MFCDKHIKQENILVGCVPIAAVASTPGGYTLPPAIPHYPPPHGYILTPLWLYPTHRIYLPPRSGIPYRWKGPGTRDTHPPHPQERNWYQGYPTSRQDLVPLIPYPTDRTWYQGYPTPREDLVPGIPNTPPPSNRQTPVKTLPSCNFVGGR